MDDDVNVIERDSLELEYAVNFAKPWLVQYADGRIDQHDTERDACAAQRAHRNRNGMHALTGERA